MKRFRAIALLIAGAALAAAGDVRSGIEAWQKGDHKAAVAIWQPLAERGDPDAQFNLAQAYRLGRGVRANAASARGWFEKAAEQGHLESRTILGLTLYESGDQLDGLKWLKLAAEDGEPRALLVYGTALVNGDGVTQDPLLGYYYVHRAVAKGLRTARPTLDSLDKLLPAEDRRKALARFGVKPAKAKKVAQPTKERPDAKSPVASGQWRIQLGAFARPGAAQALFARLSPALPGRQATYLPTGKMTRLLVGPYDSKGAAASACAALSARGQACIVVPAR